MKRWDELCAETKDALRAAVSEKGAIEIDMLVAFHDASGVVTTCDFFSAGRVLNDLDSPALREAFDRANRIVGDALRAEAVPFELTGPAGRIAREEAERARAEVARTFERLSLAFCWLGIAVQVGPDPNVLLGDTGRAVPMTDAQWSRLSAVLERPLGRLDCPTELAGGPLVVRAQVRVEGASEPLGVAPPAMASRMNVALDALHRGEPYAEVADAYALAAGAPGERGTAWEHFSRVQARDRKHLDDAISRAILGGVPAVETKLAAIPRSKPAPAFAPPDPAPGGVVDFTVFGQTVTVDVKPGDTAAEVSERITAQLRAEMDRPLVRVGLDSARRVLPRVRHGDGRRALLLRERRVTAPYREPAPVAPPDLLACWGCGSRARFVSVGMVYCNACGRYQGPAFPIASPLALLSREVACATLRAVTDRLTKRCPSCPSRSPEPCPRCRA